MPRKNPPIPEDRKANRPATLAQVGKAAGVSVMAVSSVLNGARSSARISAATRERILEAAAKLNYRPNAAARALLRNKMDAIGVAAVVDSGVLNYYFLDVLGGVLEAALRYSQNVTVFTLRDWNTEAHKIANFCDGRIDGLILLAPVIDNPGAIYFPNHVPLVSLHANTALPGVHDIESDEREASKEMTAALIGLGHRRILHLSGPAWSKGARLRVEGYLEALAEADIPRDDSLIVQAGYTEHEGREAIFRWMANHTGEVLPSAVFCCNDACAVGCTGGLAEKGIRVPLDVSVAGFDDTLASRTSIPQISTVKQPLVEMASLAVELLMQPELRERQESPILLKNRIVLRQSTAKPHATKLLVP